MKVAHRRDQRKGMAGELETAQGSEIDPDFHLLSRTTFGVRPGDLAHVREVGRDAWIDAQLDPDRIDDRICSLMARRFESVAARPGAAYEFKRPVLRREMVRHCLIRSVHSRRQLFEVMCGFWTDHLNISLEKGDCIYLKPSDDRLVVRTHALGRFQDMIRASVTSPAMLFYLDGRDNRVRAGTDDVPNENYARELLELHTMGAGNGYTQSDVFEAARCLSGWRLKTDGFRRGRVWFDPTRHDDGEKTVLGEKIRAGGGESDTDRLVEIVCRRPETVRYVCRKLCTYLVAPDPPENLVRAAVDEFVSTGGQIAKVVRVILLHEDFGIAPGSLLKRPMRLVASAIRGCGGQVHAENNRVIAALERMGQPLFQYPTPDGYPVEELPWLGTLLWRWNLGLGLAGGRVGDLAGDLGAFHRSLGKTTSQDGPNPARLFAHLCGRMPNPEELDALTSFAEDVADQPENERDQALIGLTMATPAFQMF